MKTEHFRIIYDGEALAFSEIDVRTLAPALLAIGDLLEAATFAMNGDKVKPQVNVRGSFKTGCFGIDFSLATDWAKGVKDFFAGEEATATANALAILKALGFVVSGGAVGLIALIKWLNGRKITKVELGEHTAKIYTESDLIEVEKQVLALFQDLRTRKALEQSLEPLQREGIDSFAVGSDSEIYLTLDKYDIPLMKAPIAEDRLLIDDVRKMAFSIVSLAFKEDNKWRLHDGQATISALIEDAPFLERIDKSLTSFSKGDVLVCMVAVKQWQTETGTRTEYTVTQVLEHIMAGKQLGLPLT